MKTRVFSAVWAVTREPVADQDHMMRAVGVRAAAGQEDPGAVGLAGAVGEDNEPAPGGTQIGALEGELYASVHGACLLGLETVQMFVSPLVADPHAYLCYHYANVFVSCCQAFW
jgi:hypothetical protein